MDSLYLRFFMLFIIYIQKYVRILNQATPTLSHRKEASKFEPQITGLIILSLWNKMHAFVLVCGRGDDSVDHWVCCC